MQYLGYYIGLGIMAAAIFVWIGFNFGYWSGRKDMHSELRRDGKIKD